MNLRTPKDDKDRSKSVNSESSKKSTSNDNQFEDNSPDMLFQRQLQSIANGGVNQMMPIQKKDDEEKNHTNSPIKQKDNNTGLPDDLKTGVENLSGYSMDDVKVHYNSDKPAQLQAHAYAQGTDIHLGPGQEKHLPHEAWHVAQQKKGDVKPTMQMKGGVDISDDKGLEQEADVMGAKALKDTKGDKSVQRKENSGKSIQRKGGVGINDNPGLEQEADQMGGKALKDTKGGKSVQRQAIVQRHTGAFAGTTEKKEPEFVPKSDTTAFTKDKADKISASMAAAYTMAKNAQAKVSKDDDRYKTFLDSGETDTGNTDKRVKHVKAGFDKIIKVLEEDTVIFQKYALDDGEEDETYAYVDPTDDKKEIFLGGEFWNAKVKGYDSKGGTIIHELTHELHGTDDHVYGMEGAKELAKKKPGKATTNADNYEYFAEKA